MSAMVSIIIPVYNCEPYIDRCLSSVRDQTYTDLQVIVVDDGSTDGSAEIIDRYSTDDRFEIIHQANAGAYVARSNALKMMTGDYLTFIDSDDYVEDDYIERMVTIAEDNDSELVVAGFVYEDTEGKVGKSIIPQSYTKDTDEIWVYRVACMCGRLYRRSFWQRYGIAFSLQPGIMSEDVTIALFANYAADNIAVANYAGYHYVQRANSIFHGNKGLRKYGFPYDAINMMAERSKKALQHNSRAYFEFGIIKLFSQFYFQLGRGVDRTKKEEMGERFREFLLVNCPDYMTSWRYVRGHARLPLSIRGAIELFIIMVMRRAV